MTEYLDELDTALRRRGLDEARVADVVREVADHLALSGEAPQDAFGDPDAYAAALLGADGAEHEEHGYEARTFRATAVDEVGILADLGRDGGELTAVRDFGLHARRPRDSSARATWEYARRSGVRRSPILAELEPDRWIPCGRWLTWHYFKRPVALAA